LNNINYTIEHFYPKGNSNGYGIVNAYRRFSVLHEIPNFKSVLDVGSGPCLLKTWLKNENILCEYEAVDIRNEALELCDCNKYSFIPEKTYDLICLFGTVTYNINHNIEENKNILKELLLKARQSCNKYLVITVFDIDFHIKRDIFVYYSIAELSELLIECGFKIIDIKQNSHYDPYELIAICEVK
jgi:hypothetical protein